MLQKELAKRLRARYDTKMDSKARLLSLVLNVCKVTGQYIHIVADILA